MRKPLFSQRRIRAEFEFNHKTESYMVRWQQKEDLPNGDLVYILTVHRWEKIGGDEYFWKQISDPLMLVKLKPSKMRSRRLLIHYL